jgi:hypothetical protein
VSGNATLAGTLAVTTVNGFVPADGDSFTFVQYASRTGAFGTVTGTDAGGGLIYKVVYHATDAALVVTPPDTTDPTIGYAQTPNGSNGWFKTAPAVVSVTATDASGVDSLACTVDGASVTLTNTASTATTRSGDVATSVDGDHVVACQATDAAGNTADAADNPTHLKLDTVGPTFAPTISPNPVLLHGSATASPHASDNPSGVATSSCGAVTTATAGSHTVTCTATDVAGNTSTTNFAYVVQYQIIGFFSPAPNSKWKAGQTVPVKVALGDASGTRISDAEARALVSSASSCKVKFRASGVQTLAPDCMKYDAGTDQFLYNWKLGSAQGVETVFVEVSYTGSATKTTKSEAITITK